MTKSARNIVIGADGLIGRATAAALEREGKGVIRTTRRRSSPAANTVFLDLADPGSWNFPDDLETAYFCAGETSIGDCRKDPEATGAINVTRSIELTKLLCDRGVFVVLLSTNFVFDGSAPKTPAETPFSPQTEYGRQKARLETAARAFGPQCSVIRPTKVISPENPLLQGWLKLFAERRPVQAFVDYPLCPLSLDFLIEVMILVGERKSEGVIQISPEEEVSYPDFAAYVAETVGAPTHLVERVNARDGVNRPEHIPSYASLDSSRLLQEFGKIPPPAWDTLKKVVRDALDLRE